MRLSLMYLMSFKLIEVIDKVPARREQADRKDAVNTSM
ncbi:hypothetical protein YPPY101_3464 [Yersinia pestis PY-101]|nr:hypothetical protein YPPY101_3464 [Yersinia pestis PY-101]